MDSAGLKMSANRRLRDVGTIGVLLSVVAFAAAGCGSSSTPATAVASVAAATGNSVPSASASAPDLGNPLAFAQCMRVNGLPNFPDPKSGRSTLPQGIDPTSPQFKSASDKCKQYLGATQNDPRTTADPWSLTDKLKYSNCMRTNGLTSFPDPDKDGGLQFDSSIDPNSALFKKAEKACSKYEPQNTGLGGAGGGAGGAGGGA